MKLTLEGTDTGILITVELLLLEPGNHTPVRMEGEAKVSTGNTLQLLTDPSHSRQAAAAIVGRMITQWKMDMIDTIDEAIVAAARQHLGSAAQTAPEADEH